jgi:hypothetical protein
MATPIGTVGNLVKVIRTQLSVAHAKPAPRRPAGARRAGGSSPYAPDKLEALIEMRVKKLARDDPRRGPKAFRVFLEAVLLSHFGDDLINDAKFFQLVDDVQNAMESEPQCQRMVDSAIAHLLSQDD